MALGDGLGVDDGVGVEVAIAVGLGVAGVELGGCGVKLGVCEGDGEAFCTVAVTVRSGGVLAPRMAQTAMTTIAARAIA